MLALGRPSIRDVFSGDALTEDTAVALEVIPAWSQTLAGRRAMREQHAADIVGFAARLYSHSRDAGDSMLPLVERALTPENAARVVEETGFWDAAMRVLDGAHPRLYYVIATVLRGSREHCERFIEEEGGVGRLMYFICKPGCAALGANAVLAMDADERLTPTVAAFGRAGVWEESVLAALEQLTQHESGACIAARNATMFVPLVVVDSDIARRILHNIH